MEKKTNKQLITNPGPHRFSPVSSGSFIAELHLIFRALIQFELIFVKGVRSASRLLCVCASIVCEETLLSTLSYFCSFVRVRLAVLCVSASGLSVRLPPSVGLVPERPPCCGFCVSPAVGCVGLVTLLLLFGAVSAVLGLLLLLVNSSISLS